MLVCLWAWALQLVIMSAVSYACVCVCMCEVTWCESVPHSHTCLKQTGILTHSPGMWPLNNWDGCLRLDRAGWPPLILTERRMSGVNNMYTKWRPVQQRSIGTNRISIKTCKSWMTNSLRQTAETITTSEINVKVSQPSKTSATEQRTMRQKEKTRQHQ